MELAGETLPSHILFVTYPAQGHINPGLQFVKGLTRHRRRVHVTFLTCLSAYRRMSKTPTLENVTFASFSDGHDDGYKQDVVDVNQYLSELERCGSQAVKDIIVSSRNQGHPFTCVVYSIIISWVAEVARSLHLPSALLWIQPALVFDLYYYYFNGYKDVIRNLSSSDPIGDTESVQFPGLSVRLKSQDLPSFLLSSNIYDFGLPTFRKHFELLEQEANPVVLVNSFDELEHAALRAIGKFSLIPIGPLIPAAFFNGTHGSAGDGAPNNPADTSFGGDIFRSSSNDYIDWLNSKPKSSVVYVSFGTVASLSNQQMEEIAYGLISSGRPFLWVIRENPNPNHIKEEDELSCRDELDKQGKIVQWCAQLDVLSNPALGCFISHCGWNSCLESMVCGVPMVAIPQWTDQATNAKIITDLTKSGIRVSRGDSGGVIGRDEIQRCLELVMGDSEKGEEIRRNAAKWKDLAKKSAMAGSSSDLNFTEFFDKVQS